MKTLNNPVFLYCDGAYIKNESCVNAGYGICVVDNNKIMASISEKIDDDDNLINSSRAEIIAIKNTLSWLFARGNRNTEYIIVSDCLEVVECMVGRSKRKSNKDLWLIIENVSKSLNKIGIEFSVAHCDKAVLGQENVHTLFNKQADLLAYSGANRLAREYKLF